MDEIRPRDVLAWHCDMADSIGNGDTPLGYYLDSVFRLDYGMDRHESRTRVSPIIARNLANSRAYLITANMTEVINYRSARMNDLTRINEIRPPYSCGFAVLATPIRYTELRGREQLIHALSWGPATDQRGTIGWLIPTYNDVRREPDEIALAVMDKLEARSPFVRWHGVTTYWAPHDIAIGEELVQPSEEDIRRVARDGDQAYPVRNIGRAILALWELLGETVTGHSIEYGDRATNRRAVRRKLPTEITVITLRRQSQPIAAPGTGTAPEHRVWVEGHRRRYWVGSGAARRLEWRNVRGHWWPKDPDLPIRDRPKVIRLAR